MRQGSARPAALRPRRARRPEDELQGIRLSFHYAPAGTTLPGGIAADVLENVWLHPELRQAGLEETVRAVIAGERERIAEPDPPVTDDERERILRAYHERLPASGIHSASDGPEAYGSLHIEEIERRMDAEIPPRADGERWYGATLRAVVRRAGLAEWDPRQTR